MTKEEILNGMSEEEFYSLYPTREAWEQAQQQMAYGGIPDIMGVPFGAGIMLANGGTPYYGGPIYPAQYGTSVFTEKKMTPQQWEKYNIERGYQKVPAGKAQSNKPGAYSEFYNPKEYTMGEEAWGQGPAQSFKKVGAPADYDYNKDPNYKPIVQYGYKDPIVSKPVIPWSPAGTVAGSKEGLFYKNQNPALGKFVFREGKYTQYMDDQVAAATPVTPSPAAPVINKYGGAPCYECGGLHMEEGGGLSRGEDYGSKKKPYPSVKASDFAGGGRSYPIPTRADAVDALRLAGLHGRSDVKAKVYAKYPDLKKQVGGSMTPDLEGQYPIFGYGGYDSPFNYGQFPAMRSGGDLTSQGGNQDFLNNRTSTYMNYIKNNVLNNMHEEESQKVQDAFMQMEYGNPMPNQPMMAQYGAQLNPQNEALQDMYRQQMAGYKDRSRQDFHNFGAMTEDFLGQITAKEGRVMMPNWEYSNYIPQNDIRTGYALGKSDFAKLAKLQGQAKLTGAKLNYGTLGRFMPRVFGPKSIEIGYINPNKGMFEDLKEPLKFDQEPEQQERKRWFNKKAKATPAAQQDVFGPPAKQYNSPIEAGIRQTAIEKMMNPFSEDAQRQLNIMKNSEPGPQPLPADTSWEDMMSKKNTAMAPYSEQFRAYGGLFKAQKGKSTPISMDEWKESLRFKAPTVDDSEDVQVPSMDTSPIKEQTEEEAFADVAGIQKRRQEQRDLFGPPKDEKPDLFASDSVTAKKKTTGVGRFLGKNAGLIADTASSILEQKDYNKAKKKLEESMLADNAFMTSPMNAKNRGDYDINSGMFRPDQMVPVQFPGYAQWGGFNTMAFGGDVSEGEELDLSPEEIDQLRQQGYEIEYLD